jgi:hypothetical protein
LIVDGTLRVESLIRDDWARVRDLVDQYGDLPLGGTDASLVAIVERLRVPRIATVDRTHSPWSDPITSRPSTSLRRRPDVASLARRSTELPQGKAAFVVCGVRKGIADFFTYGRRGRAVTIADGVGERFG